MNFFLCKLLNSDGDMKNLILCICIFGYSLCYSANIPDTVKKEYALKFHEAFILQSVGNSTQAFFTFQNAFQQGTQVGESPQKLQAIANLFYWYRKYGSHLDLFGKEPGYNERISDAYHGQDCKYRLKKNYHKNSSKHKSSDYNVTYCPPPAYLLGMVPDYSEWGKNPRQASQVRNFMFGVGEIFPQFLFFALQTQLLDGQLFRPLALMVPRESSIH
jgi:hypothetical protein